jgi:hypothetical protein
MNPHEFLKDIREEHDIRGGIIRNPGRFECECEWVPYYWELALDGEGEDVADYDDNGEIVGGIASRFVVDSEEADAFGLGCGATVEVFQDSQGFVIGSVLA